MSHDLDCDELVELVTDYIEDRLDPGKRARVEAHLRLCEGCDVYLAQIHTLIGLAPEAREAAVPALAARLLPAFRAFAGPHTGSP
jgi:anti-sigma factor RsiW